MRAGDVFTPAIFTPTSAPASPAIQATAATSNSARPGLRWARSVSGGSGVCSVGSGWGSGAGSGGEGGENVKS